MIKSSIFSLLLILTFSPFTASAADPAALNLQPRTAAELFPGFQNPPAEARPFVRWWWSNNQVETEEALRELDLLKAAGFGGVEINPILDPALSWERKNLSEAPILEWRSPEWDRVVQQVGQGATERGLIVDLLGGSGWPFGGNFIPKDQQIQRLSHFEEEITGPSTFRISREDLFKQKRDYGRRTYQKPPKNPELLRIWIFPKTPADLNAVRALPLPAQDADIEIDVPAGPHVIVFGVLEHAHRMLGNTVSGAEGPALDHFQSAAIGSFMQKILGMEETWGEPLSTHIRSIFCDSLELAEANWTHDMLESFQARKGYDISPWLPFVLLQEKDAPPVDAAFQDSVRRARYDWNEHNAHLVKERFIRPFTEIAHAHNLLSRLQTYGNPFYMDMPGGYMLTDIPEGNNVIYAYGTQPDEEDFFTWKQSQGYMAWNKYAEAGTRLQGNRITSAESMTNVLGFFQTTLATIKQADDMNFITGINHTVLHGYNYTPPDMDFPGFIRFGTFFSEYNTWWPHIRKWADQNARLSYIFQNTAPVSGIGLLGPTADIWSKDGLNKNAFNSTPAYFHQLWEPLAQLGPGSTYLHEAAVANGTVVGNRLRIGAMEFDTLWIIETETLEPQTADILRAFAAAGGRLIFVGSTPSRSPGLQDAASHDRHVQQAIQAALQNGAKKISPPSGNLRSWTETLLKNTPSPLRIETPDDGLYSRHHRAKDAEVFYFTNTRRHTAVQSDIAVSLPPGQGLWRLDPETGTSTPYPSTPKSFSLDLQPLESILLISGPAKPIAKAPALSAVAEIKGPWQLAAQPIQNGTSFQIDLQTLRTLETHPDARLQNFAGTLTYQSTFSAGEATHLELGNTQGMITDVVLNGQSLGTQWATVRRFDLRPALRPGDNQLELRYTTTLFNGMIGTESFDRLWNKFQRNQTPAPQPYGLLGPIQLLSQ